MPKAVLYINCRELPIHNFNEADVYGSLEYLIKEKGEYTEVELLERWGAIYDEYIELLDDDKLTAYYRDRAEIFNLNLRVEILSVIFELERHKDFKDEAIRLKNELNVKNTERAYAVMLSKLEVLLKEFELKYNNDKKDKGGIDDVIPVLIAQGYNVDRHRMVVSEYVGILNNLKKQSNKRETDEAIRQYKGASR